MTSPYLLPGYRQRSTLLLMLDPALTFHVSVLSLALFILRLPSLVRPPFLPALTKFILSTLHIMFRHSVGSKGTHCYGWIEYIFHFGPMIKHLLCQSLRGLLSVLPGPQVVGPGLASKILYVLCFLVVLCWTSLLLLHLVPFVIHLYWSPSVLFQNCAPCLCQVS